MTRVRLPTTPIPPPSDKTVYLGDGVLDELCGVLTPRDEEDTIAEQITALLRRCHAVVVVDDGSTDGTVAAAEAAGARVLVLPAPSGEGAALRSGLRLARELGYIGGLIPCKAVLSAADLDALAVAHKTAPEAILLAVGPGEAIAGKEWDEAAAIARGEEPVPYPDFRPPRAPGLHGRVEDLFEAMVETRYAYPWGGPRIVPLQPILRRNLRQNGSGIDKELLALAVKAGTPTVEVEVSASPERVTPTCKRAAVTLIGEFAPVVALSKIRDSLGMGSGYAPPTMSPLLLALGAGVLTLFSAGGCAKQVAVASPIQEAPCAAVQEWPGGGDADTARSQLLAVREAVSTLLVDQGVTYRETVASAPQRLHGLLAVDGPERLRLRWVGPMAAPVLDYVEADGHWALSLPALGIFERGEGRPSSDADASGPWSRVDLPVSPARVAMLLRSLDRDAGVRWAPGECAVLQQMDGDQPSRSLRFVDDGEGWTVREERLMGAGEAQLLVTHADYRPVTDEGLPVWPYRSEIRDARGGAVVLLETNAVRTAGFAHMFALPESF